MSSLNLSKFLAPDNPLLNKVSEVIDVKDIQSIDTKKYIEEMLAVAYGEQKEQDKPLLVGLAAPQIEILKRIILVDVIADGKGKVGDLRLFINPQIIWKSEEQEEWYEGCFSTSRVCGIVQRPLKIKVRYHTKDGKALEEEYSGYTARIFQHEIDHLDGREFVSRITDNEKLHWVEKEEFPKYRNEGAWRNWPNKCSWEKWREIKGK